MQDRALMDIRSAPQAVPQQASGVDFLRVLRRHQEVLLATFLIVVAVTAVTLIFIQPRYQATAVMRVDTGEVVLPTGEETAASIRDAELRREHQIETQIQLLQSRPLARQVVRDLGLHDDLEFNPDANPDKKSKWGNFIDGLKFWKSDEPEQVKGGVKGQPSPQLIERVTERLLEALKVEQDGQSSFVDVTVTSTSPDKAARIANKITRVYVKTQVDERQALVRSRLATLSERVSELRNELVSTEQSIATYRRSRGLDAGPGADANSAELGRAAAELAAARGMRAEADRRSGGAGQVMSPLLAELQGQQSAVQRRLSELTTLYGNGHPDVRKAQAELTQIAGTIATESSRVRSQLSSEASATRSREAQLAGDVASLRARSLQNIVEGVPLADLERKAQASQTVYLTLLGRLNEIQREEKNVRADATIASPALQPTQPSFPRRAQIMGAAAVAAIIFGLIVVMLSEALDTQVRSASHVWSIAGLPTLGLIPKLTNRRGHRLSTHEKVIDQPYSTFAESVRSIESRLARQAGRLAGNVVLVTSPLPGDGKSTVSIGLAAAAIARGRRAIVLDFDLRRPGLGSTLEDSSADKDLLDYLAGEATLDEIIMTTASTPVLHGVKAHRAARDPGASIASPRVETLISALRTRYDLIVINTPPVLAVGDAQELARHADQTVMVLRWGRTTPDLLRSAILQFGEPITGAALNRVQYRKHARLRYGDSIQHYRKYGEGEEGPAHRLAPLLRLIGLGASQH